jgi:hypothetical protein
VDLPELFESTSWCRCADSFVRRRRTFLALIRFSTEVASTVANASACVRIADVTPASDPSVAGEPAGLGGGAAVDDGGRVDVVGGEDGVEARK